MLSTYAAAVALTRLHRVDHLEGSGSTYAVSGSSAASSALVSTRWAFILCVWGHVLHVAMTQTRVMSDSEEVAALNTAWAWKPASHCLAKRHSALYVNQRSTSLYLYGWSRSGTLYH